jgi:hypothetical protein
MVSVDEPLITAGVLLALLRLRAFEQPWCRRARLAGLTLSQLLPA